MNLFKRKALKKILIVLCTILMLFNFILPQKSYAAWPWENAWLGILRAPAWIFSMIENGVLNLLNLIMSDDTNSLYISPETIIKGKFLLTEPNIFKDVPRGSDEYYDVEKVEGKKTDDKDKNGRDQLRKSFARWYYALRNLAITGLLSILVYVAIRMIISSTSQDKAKYKVMIKDWLVALCLLFAMHYIMVGILNMSSLITNAIGTSGNSANLTESQTEKVQDLLDFIDSDSNDYNERLNKLPELYGQVIVLGAVVVYTIIFLIKYLKRMITILFLILIAPISCITYPIDKIADGKAQAYNRWFQEFFFQVIIQPFHLLIYIVLVSSASELAKTNILYSIMCFAVMLPAEKFVKEMFGFKDKLGSPMGDMMKAGLIRDGINRLTNRFKGGSANNGNDGRNGNSGENTSNQLPPKTANVDEIVEGNGGENQRSLPEGSGQNTPGEGVDVSAEDAANIAGGSAEIATAENMDSVGDGSDKNDDINNQLNGEQAQEQVAETENAINQLGEASEDNENEEQRKHGKWRSLHDQRMLEKYGTMDKRKRWVKRAGRGAKALLKGAALTTAGTLAAATMIATGKTKGLVGLGGALAYAGGKKAIKGFKSAKNAAGAYSRVTGKNAQARQERNAFKQFRDNPSQVEKAKLSFMKRNKGALPSHGELLDELNDRFALSRYGLSDDEIDKALPMYKDKVQELLDSGKDEETAESIAGSQAQYAANLASAYSAKEFRDPKKMETAFNNLTEGLQKETGCNDQTAKDFAGMYLRNAAKIKGVDSEYVKLPTTTQTIDIDAPTRSLASALGISTSGLGSSNIEHLTRLNIRMKEQGLTQDEIGVIASTVSGSNTEQRIANFSEKVEASVEYLGNKDVISAASNYLGQGASQNDIKEETKSRLMLTQVTGVSDQGKIDKIRAIENGKGTRGNNGVKVESKTQLQKARELSVQTRGATKGQKTKLEKELTKELMGGNNKLSEEEARKQAKDTMTLAGQINSIN